MSENANNSSISAAELRREARKRRILENSENRLKIIAGESVNIKECKTYDKVEESSHNLTRDLNDHSLDHKDHSHSQTYDYGYNDNEDPVLKITDYLKNANLDENGDGDLEKETNENGHLWQVVIDKRLHYVVLAMIVYVMLALDLGFLFYETIICPFYTIKIIEYVTIGRNQRNNEPNLIMMLLGMSSGVLSNVHKIYSILSSIFTDFCLYFFTFITIHMIFN